MRYQDCVRFDRWIFGLVCLGLYTTIVFHWPHILRTGQVWRTVFSVRLASSLTYIRSAAVVNSRIVAHPLEVGSKRVSIVEKRDSLMHRDYWVNSRTF